MSDTLMAELNALWQVRFGQPLPIVAEPELIIRVLRRVEEKRIEEAAAQAAAG